MCIKLFLIFFSDANENLNEVGLSKSQFIDEGEGSSRYIFILQLIISSLPIFFYSNDLLLIICLIFYMLQNVYTIWRNFCYSSEN